MEGPHSCSQLPTKLLRREENMVLGNPQHISWTTIIKIHLSVVYVRHRLLQAEAVAYNLPFVSLSCDHKILLEWP
jgi:hypothetical protein